MTEHHSSGSPDGVRWSGGLDRLPGALLVRLRRVRHAVVLSDEGPAVGASCALSCADAGEAFVFVAAAGEGVYEGVRAL